MNITVTRVEPGELERRVWSFYASLDGKGWRIRIDSYIREKRENKRKKLWTPIAGWRSQHMSQMGGKHLQPAEIPYPAGVLAEVERRIREVPVLYAEGVRLNTDEAV